MPYPASRACLTKKEEIPMKVAPYGDLPMKQRLLQRIKKTILDLEPEADVILYGSRARRDESHDSDWDLLVLLNGPTPISRLDAIQDQLYEIEWETGDVLCPFIRNREEWHSSRMICTPFYQNVEREGVRL